MPEPLKVLLVEPNDQLRCMARKALNAGGFRVVNEAHSVEQASSPSFIRQLKEQRPHIAVITEHFRNGDEGGAHIVEAFNRHDDVYMIPVAWFEGPHLPLWANIGVPKRESFVESVALLHEILRTEENDIRRSVADAGDSQATAPVGHAFMETLKNEEERRIWRSAGKDAVLLEAQNEAGSDAFLDREFLTSYY